jgi:hypothetical protein
LAWSHYKTCIKIQKAATEYQECMSLRGLDTAVANSLDEVGFAATMPLWLRSTRIFLFSGRIIFTLRCMGKRFGKHAM